MNMYPKGNFDLQTAFHTFYGCAGGIADKVNGTYSACKINYATDLESPACTDSVRIIQHEISHCFGTDDPTGNTGPCTPGEDCIMQVAFVYSGDKLDHENIWCSKCAKAFDKNKP